MSTGTYLYWSVFHEIRKSFIVHPCPGKGAKKEEKKEPKKKEEKKPQPEKKKEEKKEEAGDDLDFPS
jgi:hypothetical protein